MHPVCHSGTFPYVLSFTSSFYSNDKCNLFLHIINLLIFYLYMYMYMYNIIHCSE